MMQNFLIGSWVQFEYKDGLSSYGIPDRVIFWLRIPKSDIFIVRRPPVGSIMFGWIDTLLV